MYLPYIRGKQFDLLALKELVEADKMSNNILPIIEPVKFSTTLVNTVKSFAKRNKKVVFVLNPSVGNFHKEYDSSKNEKLKNELATVFQNSHVLLGIILENRNSINMDWINNYSEKIVPICRTSTGIALHSELIGSKALYNIIKDSSEFTRSISLNRISLEDKFNAQKRNSDYVDIPEELFSTEHLHYKKNGFIGFSDYSIVGFDFSGTGFKPYAVAIHIVYFDEDKNLMVKHYTSDSNDDYDDTPGKFKEAIEKLVNCNIIRNMQTDGLNELRNHYDNEHYPGLGVVKKLSIKHHIELMDTFLKNT